MGLLNLKFQKPEFKVIKKMETVKIVDFLSLLNYNLIFITLNLGHLCFHQIF
jgi:hypothetical protein